jgi:hypothetical protein
MRERQHTRGEVEAEQRRRFEYQHEAEQHESADGAEDEA